MSKPIQKKDAYIFIRDKYYLSKWKQDNCSKCLLKADCKLEERLFEVECGYIGMKPEYTYAKEDLIKEFRLKPKIRKTVKSYPLVFLTNECVKKKTDNFDDKNQLKIF